MGCRSSGKKRKRLERTLKHAAIVICWDAGLLAMFWIADVCLSRRGVVVSRLWMESSVVLANTASYLPITREMVLEGMVLSRLEDSLSIT